MVTIISMIVTTTMMEPNSVKELVKVAHNDTQHQNSAHPKPSPIDWCSWPMHNVTWYLYPYHNIEDPEPYDWNIYLKPSRKHTVMNTLTLGVYSLIEIIHFSYLVCSNNTWCVLCVAKRTPVLWIKLVFVEYFKVIHKENSRFLNRFFSPSHVCTMN